MGHYHRNHSFACEHCADRLSATKTHVFTSLEKKQLPIWTIYIISFLSMEVKWDQWTNNGWSRNHDQLEKFFFPWCFFHIDGGHKVFFCKGLSRNEVILSPFSPYRAVDGPTQRPAKMWEFARFLGVSQYGRGTKKPKRCCWWKKSG